MNFALFSGVMIFLGFVMLKSFNYFMSKKWRKTHKNREIYPKNKFIQYFIEKGYSNELIEVAYDVLCKSIKIKEPKFYPEDNLHTMYFKTDLELKDIISEVCLKLKIRYPKEKDWKAYKEQYGQITDFEGFVRYLQLRVDGEI